MREDEPLVTVYETTSQSKVALARLALDEAGIRFSAANDLVSTLLPFDGVVIVRFEVLESDAERARQVLAERGFQPSE